MSDAVCLLQRLGSLLKTIHDALEKAHWFSLFQITYEYNGAPSMLSLQHLVGLDGHDCTIMLVSCGLGYMDSKGALKMSASGKWHSLLGNHVGTDGDYELVPIKVDHTHHWALRLGPNSAVGSYKNAREQIGCALPCFATMEDVQHHANNLRQLVRRICKHKETPLKNSNNQPQQTPAPSNITPSDKASNGTNMKLQANTITPAKTTTLLGEAEVEEICKRNYWSSTNARQLFLVEEDDVREVLQKRIELLKTVQSTHYGYKQVIQESTTSPDFSDLTEYSIHMIRQKALFITRSYQIALQKLRIGVHWIKDCCQQAVDELNELGFDGTVNAKTLSTWCKYFAKDEKFPHPNPLVRIGKEPKPPIFEFYPQLEAGMREFVLSKLDCFTVEMMRSELATKLIPDLFKEAQDNNETDTNGFSLLSALHNSPPSYSTTLRWLHLLKFRYSTKRKSYMVDGHEHPEQRKHRSWLTKEYTTKLEKRTHRWIQLPRDDFEQLAFASEVLKSGYKYTAADGTEMIEFHVDDHDTFQLMANEMYGDFGGNISVRCPDEKALILFGQDESVFNQFAFGSKQWVGSGGQRAILPKSEGAGIMVSALQSREFGFGMELTKKQIDDVNSKRRSDREYFDKDAANDVYGDAKKPMLDESPFIKLLEYGSNKDGYWTGSHMICQLEDCIDVLRVLHGDLYDFGFLLDHSSGHAKKKIGGLDAAKMTKGFGGNKQRSSKIGVDGVFVGKFYKDDNTKMVKFGHNQRMNWDGELADDDGPFMMSLEQRLATKEDRYVQLPESEWRYDVEKSKDELIKEVKAKDNYNIFEMPVLKKKSKRELQQLAGKMDIPIYKVKKEKLIRGWKGRGKGLLQILWERGFVDEKRWKEYQVTKYDSDGNLVPELSLLHLMESCTDFANEMSQLEFVGKSLGVTVLITTKYHAEFAGEGIEYSWGIGKSIYRRQPLEAKKGKDNFRSLVNHCISRNVLTVHMIRRFSKRARGYMLAYMALECQNENTPSAEVTQKQIEKMKEMIKSHRAALDFDKGFLMEIIVSDGIDVSAVLKSENTLSKDIRMAKKRKHDENT